MAFIRCMVQAYKHYGRDPTTALAKAQITPSELNNPQAKVSALQMEWMSEAAMRELDDEALGWFERRLPWGSYGMLLRASLNAPNLGVALRRWCRHHGLLTDSVTLSLSERDGVATLCVSEVRSLGGFREFAVVSLLRNALGVACWLSDSRIPLHHTTLAFAPPQHVNSYRVLFDGPTEFNAHQHSLSFDAGYLALPVRRDEVALRGMLQRALLLTVRPYRRDRLLVDSVRQALRDTPALGRNAEALAAHLNLSTRTLHRQLKEEGASLQTLKDGVRREQATHALQRTQKAIKHIAAEVGFQNEKSFMRAFKAWMGQTPQAYRQGLSS